MTSDDEHNSSFDLREAKGAHHLNTHEVLGVIGRGGCVCMLESDIKA